MNLKRLLSGSLGRRKDLPTLLRESRRGIANSLDFRLGDFVKWRILRGRLFYADDFVTGVLRDTNPTLEDINRVIKEYLETTDDDYECGVVWRVLDKKQGIDLLTNRQVHSPSSSEIKRVDEFALKTGRITLQQYEGIIVNVCSLDISGERDLFTGTYLAGLGHYWYDTASKWPHLIEGVQRVTEEEALNYVTRKAKIFEDRVNQARNSPEDVYKRLNEEVCGSDCSIQFSGDKSELEMQLRLIGCIDARKMFRQMEIYNILKQASTTSERVMIQKMYSFPSTNVYVVLEHRVLSGTKIQPPFAVMVINQTDQSTTEEGIADELATRFPQGIDRRTGPYICFEVPEYALDLVGEVITMKRTPYERNNVIFDGNSEPDGRLPPPMIALPPNR